MIIPNNAFPSIDHYEIEDKQDPLVSLSNLGLLCESQYYAQGIPGSLKDCYARKTVAELLVKAQDSLPNGLRFKIYDAYRPIEVQQRLWNYYRRTIQQKEPSLTDEELDRKTSFFVSKPSYDENNPSLHNTGGAVDLTIVTNNGYALNMGTLFDDFTDRAWTNHFEDGYDEAEMSPEVRDNRRLLYETMINAGFTNLPSEWWHYDYGTKFWGYFTGKKALYKGILTHDLPGRFPLT